MHALIVGTGVIAYWRGLWMLLDYALFPEQPMVSSIISMLLGISILFVDDFRLDELR